MACMGTARVGCIGFAISFGSRSGTTRTGVRSCPSCVSYSIVSALGHKRTYAPQLAMSALHPIATTKADMCQWSCPLYPRKRTCAMQGEMPAMGQEWTSALFDHLVRGTGSPHS